MITGSCLYRPAAPVEASNVTSMETACAAAGKQAVNDDGQTEVRGDGSHHDAFPGLVAYL
jgi:hypothetical protein